MDPIKTLSDLWHQARWPFLGIAMCFSSSWLWALVTSRSLLAEIKNQKRRPALSPKPMKKIAQNHAKNALVNILAFPGLGSLRSGRWVAGWGQLFLTITGSALMLTWVFKIVSQYYDPDVRDYKAAVRRLDRRHGRKEFCLQHLLDLGRRDEGFL